MTLLTLLAGLLGTLAASRRATFWWLPRDGRDNASSLALAAAELASHGVTDVIVYCQFVLGPNATLYVNASDVGRGSVALCPDALRAARAGGLGVQLMLGTTQADKALRNSSWVAAACADPPKIARALASFVEHVETKAGATFDGVNFDFEPWPHSRDPAVGAAYARLLAHVGPAVRPGFGVSVCVANWTAHISNYTEMALAASAGIYDMSTYHAHDAAEYRSLLGKATRPLAAAGLLNQLASGLATYSDFPYEDDPESVGARFAALAAANVSHVAMFAYPRLMPSSTAMRAAWWAAIEAWADPAARPRAPTFLVGRIYNSSSCAAPRQLGSVFLLDACLPYGEQSRLFTRGVLDEIVEERFGDGACSPALAINNITVTTEAGRCVEYYEDYSLSAVFSLEASLPSDLSFPTLELYPVGDEDCSAAAGLISELGLCSPHGVRYRCTAGRVERCTYSSADCRGSPRCEPTSYKPDQCDTSSTGGYAFQPRCE